jgi:HlyD family secretion protein
MTSKVDLRELAVRRDSAAGVPAKRSWHVGTRVILPGVVLLGFVAVIGWAARDRFLPAQAVIVAPVITAQMDVQSEGSPLFQAAGWIEPRPTPVLVTALTEGVVEKLLVVEGQQIKVGHIVAQLIQDDAKLAFQSSEADRELRRAEVAQAEAMLAVARAALPSQLLAARSKRSYLQEAYDSRKEIFERGALPRLTLPHTKSELDSAANAVVELEIRQGKVDGIRPFAEAEATVKIATARLKQPETAIAVAKLRLDRTIVKAPVDGQIIALVGKPGQRLMGQSPLGHQEASTVVTMFDPTMIQVRADVRLEDVPKVHIGQCVFIDTPVTPDALEGVVLQMTSQADIQKNTLQVKVSVKSPPPTLRPDMLVQATFLAPPTREVGDADKQVLRVLIPKQFVESADGSTHVWAADLTGKVARKKAVKLGRSSGDFVEVTQGLTPADRLITEGRQGLSDGQRIAVSHADAGVEGIRHDGGPRPKRLPNPDTKQEHSGKH